MLCMIKILSGLFVLVCMFIGTAGNVQAYTGDLRIPGEGITQIITLEDGSTLVGKITEIRADQIKFQTDLGEMSIALAKVITIKEVAEKKEVEETEEEKKVGEAQKVEEVRKTDEVALGLDEDARNWFPNPNRTRLLIGPTARSLKAGKGYFYDLWVFFPGLAYGLTDHIMISGGVSLIPDADEQMFYILPKYNFSASKNLDMAINLLIFRLWDETFYFALGGATLGTDNNSLTGALGLAFTDEGVAEHPAAMFGGEYRLGRRASLVGESWFIPGESNAGALGLGGIRFMGEKMTIDFGVAMSYDDKSDEIDMYGEQEEDEIDWIPYLDFVWNL